MFDFNFNGNCIKYEPTYREAAIFKKNTMKIQWKMKVRYYQHVVDYKILWIFKQQTLYRVPWKPWKSFNEKCITSLSLFVNWYVNNIILMVQFVHSNIGININMKVI